MGFLPSLIGSGGRPYVFSLASPILLVTLVGRSALTSSQGSGTGTTCKSIWLVEAASVRRHGRSCPFTTTRLSFAIPGVDCTVEVGLVFLRPEIRCFPRFHLQRWVSTQFSGRHRTAILLASYSQEQLLFLFARSYWPMHKFRQYVPVLDNSDLIEELSRVHQHIIKATKADLLDNHLRSYSLTSGHFSLWRGGSIGDLCPVEEIIGIFSHSF